MENKNISHRYCCVPHCSSERGGNISFHRFPRDKFLANEWKQLLGIEKPISMYWVVCSLHFKRTDFFLPDIPNRRKVLKRRTIPSENLPSAFADKIHPVKQRKHVQKRPEEAEKRRKLAVQNTVPILSMEVDSDKSQNQEEIVIKLVADKGIQADPVESHKRITIEDMIKTDTDMNAFTGIPSIELLDHICSASASVEKNSKALKLSLRQRILLSFIKLNLNMSFLCLAVLFGVSANSCKSYFFATVKILKKVLKYAVYWPEKDLILKRIQYVLMNSKIIE